MSGNVTMLLGWGAVVGYAVALALFVVLHVWVRHYSWVRHAVSDYAVGPSGRVFAGYNLVGTVGLILLGIAMLGSPAPVVPRHVGVMALVMVLTRIALLLAPTDLEGQPATRTGRLHYLFAIANFTLAYLVAADGTPALTGPGAPGWAAQALPMLKLVMAVSLAGVVVTLLPPLRRVFGAVERVFLLSGLLWFLLAALRLATAHA